MNILIPRKAISQAILTPEANLFKSSSQENIDKTKIPNIKLNLSDDFYELEYLQLDKIPEKVQTKKIKITGNTVFSPAELAALTNFQAKPIISQDELRLAILRINLAYRDRGYLTSGIFNLPQLQSSGIVSIPITEGKIKDIKIVGLNRLKDNYIRQRLVRDIKPVFNRDRLESALHLLQLNNLISNISATVIPGSTLGKDTLEIKVLETDPFYLELGLDNLGDLTSGSFRRQLKLNHYNLLGFGDRIYAAYTNTEGRDSLDSLSYVLPINSRDGKIGLSYGFGKLEAIEERISELDIDLNFSSLQVFLRQPVYQTPRQEFALGLGLSRAATETTLLNEPFPLSRGADEEGELNISKISFYQDYIKRGIHDRFAVRSQLSLGVDIFDATDNGLFPGDNFFIWRGQTSYLRQATPDIDLSLQSYWQLSDRELVFLEQNPRKLFAFDGDSETLILRGYASNSLSADNHILASAELQANVLKIDSLDSIFQLTPFVDFGTAWNNGDLELNESTLISIGLGVRLLVGDNFRARVDWGIPLIEQEFDRGSLQEDGITFNIEYRPF